MKSNGPVRIELLAYLRFVARFAFFAAFFFAVFLAMIPYPHFGVPTVEKVP